MAFDAETLKFYAAEAVSNYLNNGTPLNRAVADIAVSNKLTPEQVSRLVETTNKVAYLKILETATDRTITFPLASVEDVNNNILSSEPGGVEKVASSVRSPLDIVSGLGFEKVATVSYSEEPTISKQDVEANLDKVASYFRKQFERNSIEQEEVAHSLIKLAREINKDPLAGAKITTPELCKMAGVESMESPLSRPFYAAEISQVLEFEGLWKRAHELLSEEQKLREQLEKFAMFGPMVSRVAGQFAKIPTSTSATSAVTQQPKKRWLGGLAGALIDPKKTALERLNTGVSLLGTASETTLIDKGPSVWQSLRG